jgi:catechol 2,3-dioxygenase-like lactoylglutathione lyase family enzyme
MPVSEIQRTIHPTLHHYGLTTANLQTMVEWYATVLGMTVVFQTSSPLGKNAPIQVSAAWVTNDDANHRIGLIAMPQLAPDAQKSSHVRLQHTAYEYDSLDQLLDTYIRLRHKDIKRAKRSFSVFAVPECGCSGISTRASGMIQLSTDPCATNWTGLQSDSPKNPHQAIVHH